MMLMLAASKQLAVFIDRHPTVKMLALFVSVADRHDAGCRRLRSPRPAWLRLCRHGFLGAGGEFQSTGRKAAADEKERYAAGFAGGGVARPDTMRMIALDARQAGCLGAYSRSSKTDISFGGARCTRAPAMEQEPRERDPAVNALKWPSRGLDF
jgi:hypothetical protein